MKVQQHNYKTISISHVTSQESRQEWSWLTYLFPQKWTLAETSSFIHKAKNEWITIVKKIQNLKDIKIFKSPFLPGMTGHAPLKNICWF